MTTILTNFSNSDHPAIKFLNAIGYRTGDIVAGLCLGVYKRRPYWGTLTGTNIDLYEYVWVNGEYTRITNETFTDDKGKTKQIHHPDGLRWLSEINKSEYSQIFFNVNGGRKTSEVTKSYAVFFESDTGTFEQQWAVINSLPIKPTAVIKTRKSLHTYFALADNTLSEWVERQKRVIYATQSDPAIKNIDRQMRLPGFYHVKKVDAKWEYVLCGLEVSTGQKYLSSEIDEAISQLGKYEYNEKRFDLYQHLQGKLNNHQGQDYSQININDVFTTSDHDFDDYDLRSREYCRRVLAISKGKTDTPPPGEAFTETLQQVKKQHATSKIKTINLPSDTVVNSGGCSTLTDYLASKYAVGYDPAGRGEFATAQCPVHGGPGHSLTSLHIHRTTGAVICHGGCEAKEVIDELRERAKLAGDPLWNVRQLPGDDPAPEPLTPLAYKGDVLLISDDKDQADIYLPDGYISDAKFKAIETELKRYREVAKHQLFRLNKKQLKTLCKRERVRGYSKLNLIDLIKLPELNALDLSQEPIFDNVPCEIKIKIDHPNRLFIAGKIDQLLNTPTRADFIPYLEFDKLPNAPFIKACEWQQNHPDSMEQPHKKDLFELWKSLTSFTPDPDKIDNVRFIGESDLFKNIDLLDGRIKILSGGLGGGKTTDCLDKILNIVESVNSTGKINPATGNPIKIMVLSYRKNLVANTAGKARRSGVANVFEGEQFKSQFSSRNPYSKYDPLLLFGCVESLQFFNDRLYDGWWRDFIFIFDEADAVLNAVETGKTCQNKRAIILNILDYVLRDCVGTYALSGTLNDVTTSFFSDLDRPIDCYLNEYVGEPRPLDFCLGEGSFSQKTNILQLNQRAINEALDQMIDLIETGNPVICISDAQKRLEEIEQFISDHFADTQKRPRILRIDARSRLQKNKNIINEIMSDPTKLLDYGFDVLLYNSSAESGIDITFPSAHQQYFKKIFCFSFSVVGCNAIIQLLRRYRHPCEVFLWSATSSKYAPPVLAPDDFTHTFFDQIRGKESGIMENQPHPKHIAIRKKLEFISAYERTHPRQCLTHTLTKHGYDVRWMYLNESDTNLKESREKVEVRFSTEVFNALGIFIGQNLDTVELTDSSTWEEFLALKKARLIKNLGYTFDDYLADKMPLFTVENIRKIEYHDRQFFSYVRNRCYLDLSPADLKLLQKDNYRYGGVLSDVRLLSTPMILLQRLNINFLLNIAPLEEGKAPYIPLTDKYFGKVERWAKKYPQQWLMLCGSAYSERYFIFQLKKILKKFFGVKSYTKDGNLYPLYDSLQTDVMPATARQINDRIYKIKVIKHLENNSKYPEVREDERFTAVSEKLINFSGVEPATASDLINEFRERAIQSVPAPVGVSVVPPQQPEREPIPIYGKKIEIVGTIRANPADVTTINGITYLLGEVVNITQQIGVDGTSIELPAGIGCRILYQEVVYIATEVNKSELIYKNDWDYWCIAYNPATNTARRYNDL